MNKTIAFVVALIVVVGGGWYWYSMQQTAMPTPDTQAGINGSPNQGNLEGTATSTPQTPAAPEPLPTVKVNVQVGGSAQTNTVIIDTNTTAALGTYLKTRYGHALYTYSKDSADVSNCSGDCAKIWQPYTITAGTAVNVAAGVGGTVGAVKRLSGLIQLTYNGMPLYSYAKDYTTTDARGLSVSGDWKLAKP